MRKKNNKQIYRTRLSSLLDDVDHVRCDLLHLGVELQSNEPQLSGDAHLGVSLFRKRLWPNSRDPEEGNKRH